MSGKLTDTTKILMSFGAVEGGFEFAMQLRLDIYKKFGVNPSVDPAFCYLDAESLRSDSQTSYNRNEDLDKNFMANPNWKENYESAMANCRTMILLITAQWLKSKWCWLELDMLVGIAEKKKDLKTITIFWPDAGSLLSSGNWEDKTGGSHDTISLWQRINKLSPQWLFGVSGAAEFVPGQGQVMRNNVGYGMNNYIYACTQPECELIISQIVI